MKNRNAILAAAFLTSIVGAILFLDHAPAVLSQIEPAAFSIDQQITGNSPMLGSPTAYTVVALPENYKSDSLSQEILSDFASDGSCIDLRKKTEFVTMTESNPLLTDKAGPLSNVSGTYPMVLVLDEGRCIFKRSGRNCAGIGNQIASADNLRKLCPNCPDNPKPKPDGPEKPETPTIPDTPALPDTPLETPASERDDFVVFAVLAGAALAMVRYFQS